MDYKNAVIIALNQDRKPHAFETHWEHKILRPTEYTEGIGEDKKTKQIKCCTAKEIQTSTHLSEVQVITALNELEAEEKPKVKSLFSGGKNCLVLWWGLI